jgi:tetratricopeptide (TPR) repeat protein
MKYVFLITLLVSQFVVAQVSDKYYHDDAIFYRGEDLFLKTQYSAAREVFHEYVQKSKAPNAPLHIKARYYEAIAALSLFNNDAIPLLMQFLSDYPETIYRNNIYQKIGDYFYQKKDYRNVIVWFKKLEKEDIPATERPEFYFKLGYSYYEENDLKAARNAFYEVKDTPTEYAVPATYYFAHICYQEKNYQTALENFERLLQNGKFKEVVPYYITQIYYLQGNYEKVVAFAPSIVDSVKVNGDAEMNHMIGDAYYQIGEYDEAAPYLKRFAELSPSTRDDNYQLAYTYYKSTNYNEAIKQFDKVAMTKDTLGQVALYHIGECYLAQNKFAEARTAFESAASLDFNSKIAEDALYRSAILSYKLDVNPYDEAIEAFQLFLQKYPHSPKKKDVYAYLVNVYTSTKKYQAALDAIDKIEDKDFKLKGAYQLIAYNKGVEEFARAEYKLCQSTFALVNRYPISPKLSAQANYWSADANYYLKNYTASIEAYRLFLAGDGAMFPELKASAYYNMAYAYFNLKDMSKSAEMFRIYIQEPGAKKDKITDAYLRIADAYYLLSAGDPSLIPNAIEFYQKNIGASPKNDRALFYQAKCYGFLGNREKQTSALSDIVNNHSQSPYMVSSIFELAIISRNENKDAEAARYFQQIINDYPNNNLATESVYELGVTYLKMNNYQSAEATLSKVLLEQGENSEMCKKASAKMLELYQKTGQVNKIKSLANTFPCANISKDLQDSIYFNIAYDQYLDSNYTTAIEKFEDYLNNYPNGLMKYSAEFCLANAYFEKGDKEKAYHHYLNVLRGPNATDYETALSRTANYEYNQKQYSEAVEHYAKLAANASIPGRIYVAQLGLMRCNYFLKNWADALQQAKNVFQNGLSSKTEKIEANYTEGIASFELNNFDDAFAPLQFVCDNSSNIMAAQASYTIAAIHYQKNEYPKSTEQIKRLLKMKPAYDYWVAKGLLLQTRISIANNDLFQAEYTLKSIIKNYSLTNDGILDETNNLMNEVQQLKNEPTPVADSTQTIIEINPTQGGN